MLLRWLAERHHDPALAALGEAIDSAVLRTLASGMRTRDLGGTASTTEYADAVCAAVERGRPAQSRS
jgi:3-isopropylmalate dehydrogenase